MSKKLLIILIILSLILAGLGYILLRPETDSSPSVAAPINESVGVLSSGNKGSYVEYSSDIIEKTSGQKVLFFHAPWCPQCRSIEQGIEDQGVPDGVTVIKVDYDSNQALRKKYGVTLQTTFVKVDDRANLVDKYVAYNEPTFDAVKRNFLK